MALTSTDIIRRALRRMSVLQPGGPLPPYLLQDGLDEFDEMMDSFTARGVNINPTLPLPDEHGPGLVAILATRWAPAFGASAIISPQLVRDAEDGWSSLLASYVFPPDAMFERGIRQMPSQRLLGPFSTLPSDLNQGPQPSAAPSVSGFCVLAVGVPTTTVSAAPANQCVGSSQVTLYPYTQNAQAEWDYIRPLVTSQAGSFLVTHQNNQIADRIFEYKIVL